MLELQSQSLVSRFEYHTVASDPNFKFNLIYGVHNSGFVRFPVSERLHSLWNRWDIYDTIFGLL